MCHCTTKEFLGDMAFRDQQKDERESVNEKIDTYTEIRQYCENKMKVHGLIAANAVRDALIAEIESRLKF